ncbi:MAG: type I restriction enzyme HsdR N-terminal domain-containing protein [Nitrospirae bacterium]|nr:type I restriction enzyme HsdR N-terminal domain-containing protein [Nitrospirota bacterium]
MKFKLPEGCGGREESIEAMLKEQNDIAAADLKAIRQIVENFLLEDRGYSRDEIEIDREFDVSTGSGPARSKVDFVVSINGKSLISVKCTPDAIVSHERHALACARLIDCYQVPFAVITDGADAAVLDSVTGKNIGEGLDAIPSRAEAEIRAAQAEFKALAANRVEREKRIVCAFDVMGCSAL